MKQVSSNSIGMALAVQSIKNGGVVIFPTDTVYGIGCDPYNENAVARIYELKNRDDTKPLPILGYSKQFLENIVEFDEITNKITEKFWPGRLTIVLPLKDDKLKKLSRGTNTLAVRVPNNKCVLTFLKQCKLLIGTSANISGEKPFTNPQAIKNEILDCDIFLNDGIIDSSGASTVIKIENKKIKILRSGDISENDLADIF
ncbi:MAG: L-threonylcarbamoyladenylate synthase [Candidatus Nitrosopelagicus sp.]|jgi:L-threonylcarbamoyladenylate synthase|nr:L-threonylcarbamoyladenylate synthase [Candidatus Nitrosopelagicus sp.]